jgi:hypothetical protein
MTKASVRIALSIVLFILFSSCFAVGTVNFDVDVTSGATLEPSSFLLLGTGILGLMIVAASKLNMRRSS